MDIDEIKTLTDLMVENDLSEIMIRDGEKRIVLRRGSRSPVVAAVQATIPAAHAAVSAPAPLPTSSPVQGSPTSVPVADDKAKIKSPMVGTYYATPDPDSPPFIKVGDRVNPETVVCIIEAMKVFNEIKAEISGTIDSIEVASGTPVEFGQVLMRVRT